MYDVGIRCTILRIQYEKQSPEFLKVRDFVYFNKQDLIYTFISFESENSFMNEIFDITEWSEQFWLNTGGTRNKKIVSNSIGEFYYFKQSFFKPGRDYKFEFWSEIIACQLGEILGFEILKYHLGYDASNIGCLSKSMHLPNEELKEGGKFLQAFDNTFNPETKEGRKHYTFELINISLKEFDLDQYLPNLIDIIIFDSVIGNGDRHQENWAFISESSIFEKSLKVTLDPESIKNLPKIIQNFLRKRLFENGSDKLNSDGHRAKLFFSKIKSFAPIYDNGSSLGRELSEQQIQTYLSNEDRLLKYVKDGVAEIHWQNKKLRHFDLIKQIKESYPEQVLKTISRIRINYDSQKLKHILDVVDKDLPKKFAGCKLSVDRKEFILKTVSLRIGLLVEVLK
ncbi:hypothetical protein BH11BAC7_BH11BAC7_18810 [soil metagenome]